MLFLVLGIALLQLPAALTPTLYPDTLRYHFGLTHLFEGMSRIAPIPDFAEANLSSNWQMIYMPQLLLVDGVCAQVFNWMTLLLIASAVALAAGPGAWSVAALTLVSTPFLLGISSLGNNDLGVAFFAALMVLALRSGGLHLPVVWAGIFGGLAIGTKYPALLPVVALGLACLISGCGGVEASRRRWIIGFGAGVLVGYAPWLIRNLAWTGDPFYPVLSRWLPWCGPEGVYVGERYAREMAHYGSDDTGWIRCLLAPWRVSVAHSRFFESDPGVIFWCAIPLEVWMAWRSKKKSWMCIISLASLVGGGIWMMGPQVTRFLAPLAPILALAVGEAWRLYGDCEKKSKDQPSYLRCMPCILALFVVINVLQTLTSVSGFSNPYEFLLGGKNHSEYLNGHSPLYRTSQWLSRETGSQSRVLLFGEEDLFLFDNPVRISGPFDRKWIVDQAALSKTPADLASRLRAEDIQWICVNPFRVDSLDKRFGYASWPSPEVRKRFEQCMLQEARLILQQGGIHLYFLGKAHP